MTHPTLWTVVLIQDGQQTIITRCSSGVLANMQRTLARKELARMRIAGSVAILEPDNIAERCIVAIEAVR